MLKNIKLQSFLPFLFILILMIGAYTFAYFHAFSWENFKQFHVNLKIFNEHHPILTPLLFIGTYILYALLSLPGILVLSVLAGFLFTQPFSIFYVIIGATIGASLLFLAARTAFGEFLYRYSNRFINRLEKGFRKNAVNYLLCLRLIPFFPFWIVNLAAAFFGVSFWVFVWTTFVGMIPSVFIYTEAGRSFTLLLESADPLNPLHLLNPHLLITLIGLALLSLFPILFNRAKIKL